MVESKEHFRDYLTWDVSHAHIPKGQNRLIANNSCLSNPPRQPGTLILSHLTSAFALENITTATRSRRLTTNVNMGRFELLAQSTYMAVFCVRTICKCHI